MKRAIRAPRFRARALVRPQWDMLVDDRGRLGMDYVGRYETLQTSFDEACRRIGIPATPLLTSNTTEHRAYASYYDTELLTLVTDLYRADFDHLGYETAASTEALSCA